MEKQNIDTLVRGQISKKMPENCFYCGKTLQEKHFVSDYEGHYCNEDCYQMFTED